MTVLEPPAFECRCPAELMQAYICNACCIHFVASFVLVFSLTGSLKQFLLCDSDNVLQADILMVTDGEIPRPSETVKRDLHRAVDELGLEVHGLLVGQQDSTPAMEDICTHLHVFKSWSAVGGRRNYYY